MSLSRIIVPPIKCQGIKTKLVPWIQSAIPHDFNGRWIEPFLGSGVVVFNIRPQRALLADTNPHLIRFYQAVAEGKITPISTRQFLEKEGAELRCSQGEHYYIVRERFNRRGSSLDFLFLNRSCFNGLIRFNRKGEFNVPFCRKPNRFAPAYITKIVNQVRAVSDVMSIGKYEFYCRDFSDTVSAAGKNDLIYCDPPYIDRHADYFNRWHEEDEIELKKILSSVPCKFLLSTWHSNDFRENDFIERLWSGFSIVVREHFYHVGAKEKNRNPMLEALVANFEIKTREAFEEMIKQTSKDLPYYEHSFLCI